MAVGAAGRALGAAGLVSVALVGGVGLGCSGLVGGGEDPGFEGEAALDAADEAELARRAGDFVGAEAILKRRLATAPDDARSWRLLGDVNLNRGQRFPQRWKENLGWAVDAYLTAVTKDPRSCVAWGRLAAAVVGSAENEATEVPREVLDGLPLDQGWGACLGSAAMAELELHRLPTDAELTAAAGRLDADASTYERRAAAAPWMVTAIHRLDLGDVAWRRILIDREPAPGAAFVVRRVPTTGGSVDGSEPRRFVAPEWVTVSQVSGERLVYLDRKFAGHVAQRAVTRAPGCPGTTWTLEGADRAPKGACAAGPQDRRASELYDPDILKPAGVAHYHEASIGRAVIPWEVVADKPVSCLGGPVGRLFIDTPACQVSYDKTVPQARSLAVDVGQVAESEAHAAQIVDAARAGPMVGDAIAAHLADGEVGPGLPYSLYAMAQPDLTGCRGRGVYTKLTFVDGALEFDCYAQGMRFRFRELELASIVAAERPAPQE